MWWGLFNETWATYSIKTLIAVPESSRCSKVLEPRGYTAVGAAVVLIFFYLEPKHANLTSENGPTSSKRSPSPGGPGRRPWREIYVEESGEAFLCRERSCGFCSWRAWCPR
ncbi:hypothetical protein AMELA_G00119350 [Ameiurus melas]|uniref:Uncharacterized protein n=1 Tax=Ameiurus melas TaxID=219545 RepID=A0A7J6AM64_AMEME|nr:hypothetical protein AMELA_G00119350 [Ameiurus melas]